MEKYKVCVQEVLEKVIEVEAASESDAIDIVMEMYHNEEVVLDSSDFVEVNFDNLESE